MSRHGAWFSSREQESPAVYPLYLTTRTATQFLNWTGGAAELEAEGAYLELCRRFQAVCWFRGIPLRSPIMLNAVLNAPVPAFAPDLLNSMRSLGWTDKQIQSVPQITQMADQTLRRTQSIAGRWICNREYLTQLERVRSIWDQLPEELRPLFPLTRISQVAQPPEKSKEVSDPDLLQFYSCLQDFLERWCLLQLTTWDLPEPEGLLQIEPASYARQEIHSRIPPAFPLQSEDGFSSAIVTAQQERAGSSDWNDLSRFEVYWQIWRISFFEAVLERRYQSSLLPRRLKTHLQGTLEALLPLDSARIKRYRSFRNRLRSGHLRSLKEVR